LSEKVESTLAMILRAPDPVAALRSARSSQPALAPLDHIDEDGLRMAALMVLKLRFERLVRGDPDIDREHERDPEGLARDVRAYHHETPLRAIFPTAEALLFREWRASKKG
jgi:hypothetical protein